jgi:hypothetical protein
MVKKAKAAKAKSPKAKRVKSAAKRATRSAGPNVPLDTVVAFVQWLEANGHTREFLASHGDKVVTLSARSFEMVRSFVGLKQPPAPSGAVGGRMVRAVRRGGTVPACPPGYRCF